MSYLTHATRRTASAVAVVLLSSLALTYQASAAVVQYTTTGVFANGQSSVTINGSQVSFQSADGDLDVDAGGFSYASLGAFKTTSSNLAGQWFDVGFTLIIEQISPTAGNATIAGELNGTLKRRNSGLEIVFDTSSALIAPVLYSLRNLGSDGKTLALNYGSTSLDASVSMNLVPLPAAAWGGMGLIGLIGAARLRRRAAVAG